METINNKSFMQLSQEQYQTLLRAIQVASSMYGVMGDMVDEKYKQHSDALDELEGVVLYQAESYGLGHMTEFFNDKVILKEEYFSKYLDDVLEYDEYVFWDLLARRLAERDVHRNYTAEELKNMDDAEWIELVSTAEETYLDEFEQDGLDNLVLQS